ncbi:MAG: hypothetical protein DRH12_07190 [Deltaproteobacteria bacterium]|nr:MAG: hypothetical protein DRH12_07190 [Deltaproteobacteria bacterium]RLB84932.1 MAG: hypothetical protein DRH15_04115 [Deltaproteobacteria bacterium]
MTESIPPLKIETLKKNAKVFLAGKEALDGVFFLSPTSPFHGGQESLQELLCSERRYIPFEKDGKVIIIQKRNIIKVQLKDEDPKSQAGSHTEIDVRINFCQGGSIEGRVLYSMPVTHSRLSDFLNNSKEFFYLHSNDHTFLINARHISFVEQIDSK